VPTRPGTSSATFIGIRTQPWEAGCSGTDSAPWKAMPPLKKIGL
jgi:hypothetical protein